VPRQRQGAQQDAVRLQQGRPQEEARRHQPRGPGHRAL